MSDMPWKPLKGAPIFGAGVVFCQLVTTTGGALAASSGGIGILSVTKVAAKTGRYRITFTERYAALLGVIGTIIGTADAATVAAKATAIHKVRNNNISAATPYIEVQATNDQADAELEDGAIACLTILVNDSTV